MSGQSDADALAPQQHTPPVGWYPDPSGTPAWRRWEGTSWADSTMPYGPGAPDPTSLAVERSTWRFLRVVAPWGLAAQGVGAAVLASESPTYAGFRHWIRAYVHAALHHTTLPAQYTGTIGSSSALLVLTHYAVLAVTVLGIIGWLRFSISAMRVAELARYPQHHRAIPTSLLFFIPIVGPLVAYGASKDCLPSGHEARGSLGVGWALVAAGQFASIAVYVTVFSSSSTAAAWAVAGAAALAWVAAAFELPVGLEAIADDHASLGVRPAPAYS